jgi:hypothetical protein
MNYLQCPENNTIARHNVIQNGLTQRSAADQHQDLKAPDTLGKTGAVYDHLPKDPTRERLLSTAILTVFRWLS